MLSRAWWQRCFLTRCQRLCSVCFSLWQHPVCRLSNCLSSMITDCEDDYAADVQLTPTNWLINFIAIYVWTLSKLNFFCSRLCSWNVSEHLIIISSAKNGWPGAHPNTELEYPTCISSAPPLLHCVDVFWAGEADMFSIVDSSLCCPNTTRRLTYSTVLLLSPSLCLHRRRYAVTHAIWQMSAKTKGCSWYCYPPRYSSDHTVTSLKCFRHPFIRVLTKGTAWDKANVWGVRVCCGVTHLGKATRGGPDRYGLSESLFLLCSVTLRLLPHPCLPPSARRSR